MRVRTSPSFLLKMKIQLTEKSLAPRFLWRTHDKRDIAPQEMKTSHLFNTVRMIFNHSVPVEHQIIGCKKWNLVGVTKEIRLVAIREMLGELSLREDITEDALAQLEHMRLACRILAQTALHSGLAG